MIAPEIRRYIGLLENDHIAFDEESIKLIDKIYQKLDVIERYDDDETRILWVKVDRGSFDEYLELYDKKDDEDIDDIKNLWECYFPTATIWLKLITKIVYGKDRYIFLDDKMILRPKDDKMYYYDYDCHEFFAWLLDAVNEQVESVKNNTYNSDVKENLPYYLRRGVIKRADLYKALPKYKEGFLRDLSEDDISTFLKLIDEQADKPIGRYVKELSANTYYDYAIKAIESFDDTRIKGDAKLEKRKDFYDHFYRSTLRDIDQDSPEAFDKWYEETKQFIDHNLEIVLGSSRTRIDLYVNKDEEGYYFYISHRSWANASDILKIYNAFRKEDIAIYLYGKEVMVDRLLEKDMVGIAPKGVFPFYCWYKYEDRYIMDYFNLPDEDDEVDKLLPYIFWLDEIQLKLRSDEM